MSKIDMPTTGREERHKVTDRSLVKQYFPDGAIPEDFEKWVKAHGLRRHPGSRQAAFAEWVFKKANLQNPCRMTWGKVKEKLKDSQQVVKHRTKQVDRHENDKAKTTFEEMLELDEKRQHFWTKLSLCRCTVLICSTSPYYPRKIEGVTTVLSTPTRMNSWAKKLYDSAKSQSYFGDALKRLNEAHDEVIKFSAMPPAFSDQGMSGDDPIDLIEESALFTQGPLFIRAKKKPQI